ncbi:MAG: pyridoxal phosphate-dependent aminotransferase [Alphaproteobacteria bacterium]|nr:pyridoxal phosphate-dependent aminotransferase [Alphaproteobacteria bacterium]
MSAHRQRVARHISEIEVSAIKQMAILSARLPDAASLTWGLPSFRTPAPIRRAVGRALEEDPDIGKYALPDGLPELRRLAAEDYRSVTGRAVDPDRNVLITAGNMQGVNAVLHAILDAGDRVVVTDPCFASHLQQIRLCGGEPVFWPLDEEAGWALDPETLPERIDARTKAVLLVTPSNPTGAIFTEAQVRRTAELARARGLLLIVDDPYRHFTYENRAASFNPGAIDGMEDDLAYLFTFSKAYAMSGWRLGYAILPEALKREVLKVHDATLICAPRISQAAGVAALSGDRAHLSQFQERLAKRRALICARLDRLPHVFSYVRPEGAYYVFPRILVPHETSHAFALSLLEETHVAVTPGEAFGPTGEEHVRMAYCVEEAVINAAFDRMERHFGAGP